MLIPFPDVPVTRCPISPINEGQFALRSLYGSGSQVLARGPGSWRGTIELAARNSSTDADRRAVEVFITRLRGQENTFNVPLQRRSAGTLAAGTAIYVTAAAINNNGLLRITTGVATGLAYGDYVRIEDRLYHVTGIHASSTFQVEPPFVPPVAARITWENPTCLARLSSDEDVIYSWNPDFYGPWPLDWIEDI